ncbi:hypothetical protein HHK36_023808 [Tetracentron sinense]|uniref:Uncharacterized protein n=1 Tax=Tetracentron sinense TaxID=13715 RepID=A0A835D5J5_TETSI|nr:hypothetical protein HHK36_023808 [Tetracentron sinense]
MENYLNSTSKDHSSKGTTGSPKESGWTDYFEDFLSNNKEYSSCSSGFGSSLVSDAASCAAWKFSDKDHVAGHSSVVGSEKSCKKLSFKKSRTRRVLDDDALEDTASSPINSPKVSDFKQLDINPRKKDDNIDTSQGKGNISGHYSELQTDEINEMGFIGRDNDCTEVTELNKRGLCLVPLSMVVNYFG